MLSRSIVALILMMSLAGCAELQNGSLGADLARTLTAAPSAALDEQTVAAGLREALMVGTERTVRSTSRLDGFLANELIRIALPEELQSIAKTLRSVGLGKQVDDLEVAMNRSAERAAGEAKVVFFDALAQMTLADAFGILNGGDRAATDYFRRRTSAALARRFRPIVRQKMGEVGLYRSYEKAVRSYSALPFTSKKPAPDLEEHVTQRALSGLFVTLAEEEKRIRQDPAARTSALLRRVFAQR